MNEQGTDSVISDVEFSENGLAPVTTGFAVFGNSHLPHKSYLEQDFKCKGTRDVPVKQCLLEACFF